MHRYTIVLALAFATAVLSQCGSNPSCGGACYDSSQYSCATDYNGKVQLCPKGQSVCNGGCYNPALYNCNNGVLQQGAAKSSTSKAATSATTKAAVSSSRAATSSTTKAATSAATKAASSSTTATPASSSTTATPASASTGGATCQKANYCSSTMCACNGACYNSNQYCCVNGQLTQLAFCPTSNAGASTPSSSTTSNTPAQSNTATATPVVNPTPTPYTQFPTQTADLRIINNCKTQLWFEARYGGAGAPLPGQSATSIQALPGSYVDYTIPDTGLSGTRFWAKYGCDNYGKNCLIGDQMQYYPNPPGGCPPGGCTPPVDSLFEATWGCRPGSSCNSQNPTTWFDTSQVDGWTIPYKLTPVGDTSGCDCIGTQCGFKGVDASTLDVTKCPSGEDLTANGNFSTVSVQGKTVSLKSVDLRIITNGQILGCMSPCKRLNWGTPFGLQQDESSGSPMWMCCPTPTPNNCSPSNGCITPQACRAGPIENTQFVAAVHSMAPGVYSYSYDDGVGLHACPAGVTKYTMEFCPAGSAAYPGTA